MMTSRAWLCKTGMRSGLSEASSTQLFSQTRGESDTLLVASWQRMDRRRENCTFDTCKEKRTFKVVMY